jgi:hypothetical protein
MSKADVLQLVADLSRGLADQSAAGYFYDDVVLDLSKSTVLTEATLISATSGTAAYTAPAEAVDTLGVFWDDNQLSKTPLRDLETVNPNWRDASGVPRAYVTEAVSDLSFILYPTPEVSSKDFIFLFGSPLGLDFPSYSIGVVHTVAPQDVPTYLEMVVALEIMAREFARESDHRDLETAKICKRLADLYMAVMLTKNVGQLVISYDLLGDMLLLPSDVNILYVSPGDPTDIFSKRHFTVVVEGAGLPQVEEGTVIPFVSATYEDSGKGKTPQPKVKFKGFV